jgi:hypothetical protein
MVTNKRLAAGTLSDTNATLYTVPASTTTIVKSLALCNTTAAAVTVTLKLNGVEIFAGKSIAANDTEFVSLDQIIGAAELIEGSASVASAIKYSISGKELT